MKPTWVRVKGALVETFVLDKTLFLKNSGNSDRAHNMKMVSKASV